MVEPNAESARLGVDDKPCRTKCGALTFLTRRSPAAEHALTYERQTFRTRRSTAVSSSSSRCNNPGVTGSSSARPRLGSSIGLKAIHPKVMNDRPISSFSRYRVGRDQYSLIE